MPIFEFTWVYVYQLLFVWKKQGFAFVVIVDKNSYKDISYWEFFLNETAKRIDCFEPEIQVD